MSVSVSMPQLGESVTEGTVTRWLKKEGERVEVDEPLLEVSTDKVDTEIPSPASGILRGISVPVVFVTGFPERLLTGERLEPTFVVTKPFKPEALVSVIGQALAMHPPLAQA